MAGPDGGSPSKPVGLVYVAVADAMGTDVRRYQWAGDRTANIHDSAAAVLDMLLERVATGDGQAAVTRTAADIAAGLAEPRPARPIRRAPDCTSWVSVARRPPEPRCTRTPSARS